MADVFPLMELPPALLMEVLKHLDARELSIVACISRLFRVLSSDEHSSWKNFYCERWGLPQNSTLQSGSWRDMYVAREARCKALLGKFTTDRMVGHLDTIRTMRMLPSTNLVASGGNDCCIRLWDLNEGMPVACSPPLRSDETIRAIALDPSMLVAGGTSGLLWVWNSSSSGVFDILSRPVLVRAHPGHPISSLGLDSANVYSGSWDMSVKVWNRSNLGTVTTTLAHNDWVFAVAARGHRLLTTAGCDGYTWDIETGRLLRLWAGAHENWALAVEGNRSGHYIMTGGGDGAVRVFDNRVHGNAAVAAWIPHSRAVNSLAFDDPWLVSGSSDGSLAMMDLRYVIRSSGTSSSSSRSRFRVGTASSVIVQGNTVQRMLDGGGQGIFAVDIGSDRIACAGRDTFIRVWDFSRALEIQRQVDAYRTARQEQRKLQKSRHLARKAELQITSK